MSKQNYTPGQYGCAFPFLVITALIIVGVVMLGAEGLSALFGK